MDFYEIYGTINMLDFWMSCVHTC